MEKQEKELKKQYKVNIRPIISLVIGLAFFSVILIITLIEAAGDSKLSGNRLADTSSQEDLNLKITPSGNYEQEILAVVGEIDEGKQQLTLFDINSKQKILLSYSGGSNITDKYGQTISITQVPIGSMVDVGYQKEDNKLLKMQISTKAWEYAGVNNMTINRSERIMKIASTKYKYTDDIIIVDGEALIPVNNLAEQDELTVRGFEETIWSITVTRGHGTVKLEDYEDFIGSNITIGYESMQQIEEDMVITVREGNFNLTVENGAYSATKNVTIQRNKETVVSLAGLGPETVKMGKVTFDITPFGADLFIDGELTSYANPIELAYGDHDLEVSLSGFTTYHGTLNIKEAGKTLQIDLPEENSGDKIEVTVNPNGTGSENSGENNSEMNTRYIIVQNPTEASVYLNGEFKGISPLNFQKVIGTHVITFIKDGYETKSYTIEVPEDGLDTYLSFDDLVKLE